MNVIPAPIDRVVAALESAGCDPRQRGDRWEARCPAHDDHTPSLSIATGNDGRALVTCQAGCRTEDVVAALKLKMADLFVERQTDDRPKITSTYPYVDESGTTLFEVVRFVPKDFRQRTPDGHGGWTWKLNGVRRVPYRLPELRAAALTATPVFVTEGEKDADSIVRVGQVATCSPGGAGKWRPEYAEHFAGISEVVIVADRDAPGYRHAREVARSLAPVVGTVRLCEPAQGKDVTDHLVAGLPLDELIVLTEPGACDPAASVADPPIEGEPGDRKLRLTSASRITPRPVRWLWEARIALGTLCLLAGREGIGKSSVAYAKAAQITRGLLQGVYFGQPRAVIVAATEDSWEHTIVPRLMAAGADLDLIYRVDVTIVDGPDTQITLPSDLRRLEDVVAEVGAALILLDPIMSRLHASLDTHKDAEVRIALEPLVALADRSGAAVLGVIHVNKSGGGDALNMVMGSRAFGAVARSVLFAMASPEDENIKLLGQPKNNLGRSDLPTLTYQITGAHVADTDEGPIWTARVDWIGETALSIADALIASGEDSDTRTATKDAVAWLGDYLKSVGGCAASVAVKENGAHVGHSLRTLQRARSTLKIATESSGFPRQTYWRLPSVGVTDEV